ncbi:hypothetical protein [Dubosiella muris]|uniref:Uncharacterized protein n=1 Tax=Dubosiella muris TaxID=3038133 RepID=A0AC61R859_9FIRM|nr:hypothetical protein [Dubosiella muris]TGY66194.1 hypothetical protein E5336_04935 [Dubosiella muris]
MSNIEAYIQALEASSNQINLVAELLEELSSYSVIKISEKRVLVAKAFFKLLQYCQKMYNGNVPNETIEEILRVFINIENMVSEITEEEDNSNMMIMRFLHELKMYNKGEKIFSINQDKYPIQYLELLLKELDSIYFVFEIKKDSEYIFPLHKMIVNVVENFKFIDNSIGLYQIRILQLAVKLFKDNIDEQKALKALKEKCNLKFIQYLSVNCEIIDTSDLLNYQKNGVMTFYDKNNGNILIRHRDKNYFIADYSTEKNIFVEKDHAGSIIGYFYEYQLNKNDQLTDYSDILKDEEGRKIFLNLIYNNSSYNVLLDKMIVKGNEGKYRLTNPFCFNDEFIIKGRLREKFGKCYQKNELLDALSNYRCSALKISTSNIMNRVSLGLGFLLLEREKIDINALKIDSFSEDDWFQIQLIKNWVMASSNPLDSLKFIITEWYRENEYCKNILSNRNHVNLQDHEIDVLDFYPLKSGVDWVFEILGYENQKDIYVLKGDVEEKDEGMYFLKINLGRSVYTKQLLKIINKEVLEIKFEDIEDCDQILEDQYSETYFVLYDSKNKKYATYDQKFLKVLSAFIDIQQKNELTLETVSKITKQMYSEIKKMMSLHQEALAEGNEKFFCDFDSQVYYRLIHNMLWSKVNFAKIDNYLNIFLGHQCLSFENINHDEKFMRTDSNTLYIPKDKRDCDSVLVRVYEKYLKSKRCRETNDLYDENIELKDGTYFHNENRINKIVFLCDNFENGSATIRMLKAYLDIEDVRDKSKLERAKQKCQKYYVLGKRECEIKISDIISKNNCSIEIHSFYGTSEGKKKIESFLEENNLKNCKISYRHEILSKSQRIKNDIEIIWPNKKEISCYTVIREFNMPKINAFPEAMLKDSRKAICMFVMKREL